MKSKLTKKEAIAALVYLPFHLFLIPLALGWPLKAGKIDEVTASFLCYAVGFVYMLIFLGKFLRRDFDPLCDRPLRCLILVVGSYMGMLFFNTLATLIISLVEGGMEFVANQNNMAVEELAGTGRGLTAAMAVFLAPVTEELIFRAGIFGMIRKKSRIAAYIVSILAFSAYHVWSYAITDVRYLLYIIDYIPASFFLCLCYERTDTIWAPIFLHMITNGVSMKILEMIS